MTNVTRVVTTDADDGSAGTLRWAVGQARRGWLEKRHVLNTMTRTQLEIWLKQRRQRFAKVAAL